MARESYQQSLRDVQDDVLRMAAVVDAAITRSVQAIRLRDLELAQQIISEDEKLNEQRYSIEDRCLRLIATQQPVASDMRLLIAVINIITDLERMGDHAVSNARIALKLGLETPLRPVFALSDMADLTVNLLRESIIAFDTLDHEHAVRVALRDDSVDRLYEQVYTELLTFMMADPGTINRATGLMWVAHNLERIGDRATNICERVVFLTTGRMFEIRSLAGWHWSESQLSGTGSESTVE